VSTAFATRRAGDRGRVAAAAIVLLSAAALVINVTGVSLADLANGKSVLPGNGNRSGTFPGVDAGPATPSPSVPPPSKPYGRASAAPVDCGTVDLGSTTSCHPGAVLVNTGASRLTITGVEIAGDGPGEFTAGSECVGRTLEPGSSCETRISFTAAAAGPRRTTLVIHQTLPAPDRGTRVDLSGAGRPATDGPFCATDPASTDAPPDTAGCAPSTPPV
jgi:HYDIN/CFA65/VesB family protein